MNWFSFGRNLFFIKKKIHMTKKPFVSYSKKHLELRNIIYFLFAFEFAEFFLGLVLTLNFLIFSYIEFLFREIYLLFFYSK